MMKCIGETCGSYFTDFFYPICLETTYRIDVNSECKLLDNIKKSRDDLIRKCKLFEEIFETDMEDWSELIDKIRSE